MKQRQILPLYYMSIFSTQLSSAHKFYFLETRLIFGGDILRIPSLDTKDSILAEKKNKYLECTDGIANSCNELRNSIDKTFVGKLAKINKKINKDYLYLDLSDAKIDETGKYIEVGNDVAYLLSDITDDLSTTSSVLKSTVKHKDEGVKIDINHKNKTFVEKLAKINKKINKNYLHLDLSDAKIDATETYVEIGNGVAYLLSDITDDLSTTSPISKSNKSIELKPEDITMDIFNHKDKIDSIISENKQMIELYKKYLNVKSKSHNSGDGMVKTAKSEFSKSIPLKKTDANFSPNQKKLLKLMVEDLKTVKGFETGSTTRTITRTIRPADLTPNSSGNSVDDVVVSDGNNDNDDNYGASVDVNMSGSTISGNRVNFGISIGD